MDYKETLNKDLKRSYEVTVPSVEVETLVNTKILEIQKTIKMDGFRPGKVPTDLIKKQHGEQAHSEVLNDLINKNVSELVTENNLRQKSFVQEFLQSIKSKMYRRK